MFDYETLRFIWWLLIGVILVVFMISDGFDMGIGCLLPLVARNDDERRIVINSVGAHWEGNQVWLILAGGALFAAWPRVYAAAFSGFYVAMILVLCSLFFRPLAFDYRGKIADARWRKMWDAGLVIGSLVPPVVFGIAFGNLLLGVPFAFTPQLRVEYLGSFWQLLTPFPLLCGLLSLGMVILQGGVWLQLKTVGVIHLRSQLATKRAALLVMLCFLLAGYWLWVGIDGFVLLAQDATPQKQAYGVTLPTSVLFIAGHDTNLANLGGALELNWTLPGQPDNTPPGGELVFERWRRLSDNSQWIQVSLVFQTLQQMRDKTPLSLNTPPGEVKLTLAGCEERNAQGMCSLAGFTQIVNEARIPACSL